MHMQFEELVLRARALRGKYAELERRRYGTAWTAEELALGFVGDVGDLAKLVVSAAGKRDIPDAQQKLAHELADCMWSVLAIADAHGIDMEHAFIETMNMLDRHADLALQE